jgi:hypothetical protein
VLPDTPDPLKAFTLAFAKLVNAMATRPLATLKLEFVWTANITQLVISARLALRVMKVTL